MSILRVFGSKNFLNMTFISLKNKFKNIDLPSQKIYKILNLVIHNILEKMSSTYPLDNIKVFKKYLIRILILVSKVKLKTILDFKYSLIQKTNCLDLNYSDEFHVRLLMANKRLIPELIKQVKNRLSYSDYLITKPSNKFKFVLKLKRKYLLVIGLFRKINKKKVQIFFQKQAYTYSRVQIEYKKINLVLKYRPFPIYYIEINYNTLCFSITSGFDFLHFPHKTLLNFTDIAHYYSR